VDHVTLLGALTFLFIRQGSVTLLWMDCEQGAGYLLLSSQVPAAAPQIDICRSCTPSPAYWCSPILLTCVSFPRRCCRTGSGGSSRGGGSPQPTGQGKAKKRRTVAK